ncbi:uncharacterized protein LOC141608725 [Silene latifolia]|uniref:uncharacterized protein LOC141608725 n=1 Tax=Silene latifolia TaxID=37657 RepID=UPI003D772723
MEEGEAVGGGRDEQERRGEGRNEGWAKPCLGEVKLNVDVCVRDEEGLGLGVVCRNDRGMIRWAITVQRREWLEPREVESKAMLMGLKETARRGHMRIVMESDCQVLVEAVKHRSFGGSDFHLILDDMP